MTAKGGFVAANQQTSIIAKIRRYLPAECTDQTLNPSHELDQFDLSDALTLKLVVACLLQLDMPKKALDRLKNASPKTLADAEVQHNYALALARLGRYDDACLVWQDALRLNSSIGEAHKGLGIALLALGHEGSARTCLANAISLDADDRTALLLGEMSSALPAAVARARAFPATLCDAVARELGPLPTISPNESDDFQSLVLVTLGYRSLGRQTEALAALRNCLPSCPDNAQSLAWVASSLSEFGDIRVAADFARRALEHAPDDPALLEKLGTVLKEGRDLSAAASCFRASLEKRPDHVTTLTKLADTCFRQGNSTASLLALERGLALDACNANLLSARLLTLSRSSGVSAAYLSAAHRQYKQKIESLHRPAWPTHGNSREPERRLNIGLISADFKNHPVAYFLEPVLNHLAKSSTLKLHAYTASGIEDNVTRRLQNAFAHWQPVENLSDTELARSITADGIDILIDLSGHTGGNRLPALARKPAPLQASWIGYPCTTGLDAIDYFIGDRYFLPEGHFDDWFTEKIVRLPSSVAFQPSPAAVPPNQLPAITQSYIRFASFNHTSKITPETLKAWAGALRAVPDSRLLIFVHDPAIQNSELRSAFSIAGIDPDRLEVRGRLPLSKYLKAHHDVDICLDTVPYNGGTTTLHALSMGVPTLTMTGETPPGRVGASLLSAVGLDGFIAHTSEDFSAKALQWASQRDALAAIRQELPGRLARSPIGRPLLIATSLECAFRLMWRRWCEGLKPCSISVEVEDLRAH